MVFVMHFNFQKKNPKADESVRSIKLFLTKAVDGCLEAAGNEFDHETQKALLKVLFVHAF